jgi:light-regulated signal transduction histidine kinase (bacteriophytochrome)
VDVIIQSGVFANGDAILLRAVLANLLANAWKFTGKRDQARIELGQVQKPDGAANFVKDNGAGFDMEQAGKLFGVFQRFHSAKEVEGHGIGLATVQRIVRRHGGQVWAEAAVDKGATFFFSLGKAEHER